MARNQTVSRALSNMFALNRIRKECYYEPSRVDFSPICIPNKEEEQIVPCFNLDKNCYTPSFILPREKKLISQNAEADKTKFQARISHCENQSEAEDLCYKPTDNRYCQLCNECFADYWDHINGKYHKRMINASKFNKDLISLCALFEGRQLTNGVPKTKKITKSAPRKGSNKRADLKGGDKCSKESSEQNCQQKELCSALQQQNALKLTKNAIEENLKITLQLGNYSTNLVCSKPLCSKD